MSDERAPQTGDTLPIAPDRDAADDVFFESIPPIVPGADFARPPDTSELALPTSSDVDAIPVRVSDSRPEPQPERPPGPGLPESLLWTFGVLMIHFLGSIAAIIVVVGFAMLRSGTAAVNPGALERLVEDEVVAMLGVEQAIFIAATFLFCWLRLRPETNRRLPLNPIPLHHVLLLGLLVLPLSLFSGEVYRLASIPWELLGQQIPVLKLLDEMNTVEQMKKIVEGAPLPVLIVLIAVVPAVAEELVFRGVIGRGLVARWGIPAGVLITSVLFAMVHFHPVHVIGVVPLGIVMHLSYLATRSFWAPMLLHFLNNTWATVATIARDHIDPKVGADDTAVAPELLAASIAVVMTTLVLLWKNRVEWRLPDGSEWNPGYPTTDAPPPELGAVRSCRSAPPGLFIAAAVSIALFIGAFLWLIFRAA